VAKGVEEVIAVAPAALKKSLLGRFIAIRRIKICLFTNQSG